MRVLYFSNSYSPHDHRFLAALAQTEHEVHYLRLEGGGRQVEDRPVPAEIHQVPWAGGKGPFGWPDVPRLWVDLLRVLRDIQPDLVHAGPIQTCAFLTALTGFQPLLTMSWGFDLMQDAERNAWWRWVTAYTLLRSAFFVSDAQSTRDRAVSYGIKADCTAVFPWGVDLDHFCPAEAAEKPRKARQGPFTLFCNRSWESRYGVDVLARAFVRVARERPNVTLLLLNGGSQAHLIRQILLSGGALDRVQFGGLVPQADLPRWYRMADLYISPSHVDGSSVSLMEALACGLPALVSDIPANREWVTEGSNGWLFADGDPEALAMKIMSAMDRGDLSPIRHAARDTAEARANWPKNFDVLLQAYRRVAQTAG